MTKAEWSDLKDRINQAYGGVRLLCDGYLIAPTIQRCKMKLYVVVYVNGAIRGIDSWQGKESEIDQMGEIARRFHCRKFIRRPAKEIKQWEKIFGKRECKQKGINDVSVYTTPYFNSAGGFIAHIRKHNQSIEEISLDEYKRRITELEAAHAT